MDKEKIWNKLFRKAHNKKELGKMLGKYSKKELMELRNYQKDQRGRVKELDGRSKEDYIKSIYEIARKPFILTQMGKYPDQVKKDRNEYYRRKNEKARERMRRKEKKKKYRDGDIRKIRTHPKGQEREIIMQYHQKGWGSKGQLHWKIIENNEIRGRR